MFATPAQAKRLQWRTAFRLITTISQLHPNNCCNQNIIIRVRFSFSSLYNITQLYQVISIINNIVHLVVKHVCIPGLAGSQKESMLPFLILFIKSFLVPGHFRRKMFSFLSLSGRTYPSNRFEEIFFVGHVNCCSSYWST